MDNVFDGLWKPEQTGWYKVIPYEREARGNLKCLGVKAPLCINDVSGITIIHIRENLPYQNIIELNVNLRTIFGPATLVLALDKQIDFYRIEKCSSEEVKKYQSTGNPVLTEVESGDIGCDKDERLEVEEPGGPANSRSKPLVRAGSGKSNRKTPRA